MKTERRVTTTSDADIDKVVTVTTLGLQCRRWSIVGWTTVPADVLVDESYLLYRQVRPSSSTGSDNGLATSHYLNQWCLLYWPSYLYNGNSYQYKTAFYVETDPKSLRQVCIGYESHLLFWCTSCWILKTKNHRDATLFVTVGNADCHDDNLRCQVCHNDNPICQHWRRSWHNENFSHLQPGLNEADGLVPSEK